MSGTLHQPEEVPVARGECNCGAVQFEIDANGLLSVLARDIATGRDVKVSLQSAVEVSDEAVEKMLADSLEHAFEVPLRAAQLLGHGQLHLGKHLGLLGHQGLVFC